MQITKFGKFRLLKKVATGGMAELFLGCTGSSKTGYKFLIIKKVMAAQSDNKEFKKMFQNEGKVAININHRNVISMFEFGLEKEQFFICMEYLAGRNLRQLTKKLAGLKQNLSVEQCVYIIKDICLGLDYVHNSTDSETGRPLGIIHRDVSPQNIMVAFSGDVKLIDFGIAKLDNTESTRSGVLKGKFEYMSPEQVRGQTLDRQTDVFSLGVVFWELLAGRKLFTGKDEMQILRRIRSGQIPDLKQIRENVPEPLMKVIHRMLHSNKKQRYQTMAEIGSELSVFLNEYYPKFTPNHFSSFVREVYAEEILEERKTIKAFLKELKSSELVAPEGSSAGYENNDSSFVTSPHPVKNKAAPAQDLESTQTDLSLYTDAEDSQEGSYQSVTETVFDDEVETQRELVLKNPTSPPPSLKKGLLFNRWTQATNVSQVVADRKKRRLFRKRKKYITLAVLVVTGGMFFKFPELFYFVSRPGVVKVQSLWENLIEKSISSSSPPPPPASKEREVASPPPRPTDDPAMEGVKNFIIETHPSGAEVFVNQKRQKGFTPVIITVPTHEAIHLVVKKKGYRPVSRSMIPGQINARKLKVSLKRLDKSDRKQTRSQ